MRHAVDGERNTANVEFSGENRAAQLLHDVFECVPILADDGSIVQREAAIFVRVWVSEIVF